jgi:hypothetical protein
LFLTQPSNKSKNSQKQPNGNAIKPFFFVIKTPKKAGVYAYFNKDSFFL